MCVVYFPKYCTRMEYEIMNKELDMFWINTGILCCGNNDILAYTYSKFHSKIALLDLAAQFTSLYILYECKILF